MANHKSAQKRIRQTERRTEVNRKRKSQIKTAIRKVTDAVNDNNQENAKSALKNAESVIMKNSSKGILKKETASRKVSRLVAFVKRSFTAKTTG